MTRRALRRRTSARGARLAMLIATAIVAACSDFAVTNQYDARFPIQMRIAGPETTYTDSQIVAFTVETTPPWTGGPPVWTASDGRPSTHGRLDALGGGRFRVAYADYCGDTVTVFAALGPHRVGKIVKVEQRVASVRIQPDSIRKDADAAIMDYSFAAYDSSGSKVGIDCPAVKYEIASRDTNVVRVVDTTLYSVHDGQTYIVADVNGVLDSVPARVHQILSDIRCSTPFGEYLPLDDTVHIAFQWLDWNSQPLDSTPVVTAITPQPWAGQPFAMSATPDGTLYTGSQQGQGALILQWHSPDGTLSGANTACPLWVGYPPP